MIDGAFLLPDVSVGMINASATCKPATPCPRSWASTAIGSDPILQVADRVVGGFGRLLQSVEDFVIGGPIDARRDFAD
jgi:hypothetical protein